MKPNKIMRTLLFNWPIKVFSLLLAIGIYIVINYALLDTRVVEIPLQVVMPVAYEASSNVPTSVTLSMRADERYITMIDAAAVRAVADFSHVRAEGAFSAPIVLHAQKSFVDMEVAFSTDPETIRIYFVKSDVVPETKDLGGIEL